MKTTKASAAACLFVLLLAATAVESRYLLSSSSSEDSSSEAGTVLSFTASLPARRRSLLDRPASTCGEAAFPKDAEVEEIGTWLFSMADSLGLPRSACTAMGLQITAGAKSFTVFCLGNSGQLSAFSAGTVAGATVSVGTTTELHTYDITFDGGNQVILEANLKSSPAPGLPTAILGCEDLIAFEAAAGVPTRRRHLLRNPTGVEVLIITPIIGSILDAFSAVSGIPRNLWTAIGAQMVVRNGQTTVTFTIFVRAPAAQGEELVENFDAVTQKVASQVTGVEVAGAPATVSEADFPDVTVSLDANIQVPVSTGAQAAIDESGADIPALTTTPGPATTVDATTPGATGTTTPGVTDTTTPAGIGTTTPGATETTTPGATGTTTPGATDPATPGATETTTPGVTDTTTPAGTGTTTPGATETTTPGATDTTTPAGTGTTTPGATETTTPGATDTTTPAGTGTTTPGATETTTPGVTDTTTPGATETTTPSATDTTTPAGTGTTTPGA